MALHRTALILLIDAIALAPTAQEKMYAQNAKKNDFLNETSHKKKNSKDSPTGFPIGETKSNRLGKDKITTVDKLPWGKVTVRCGKSNICLDLF
jgi:hypothetical protein